MLHPVVGYTFCWVYISHCHPTRWLVTFALHYGSRYYVGLGPWFGWNCGLLHTRCYTFYRWLSAGAWPFTLYRYLLPSLWLWFPLRLVPACCCSRQRRAHHTTTLSKHIAVKFTPNVTPRAVLFYGLHCAHAIVGCYSSHGPYRCCGVIYPTFTAHLHLYPFSYIVARLLYPPHVTVVRLYAFTPHTYHYTTCPRLPLYARKVTHTPYLRTD